MDTPDPTTAVIEEALNSAAEAHGRYEADVLGGVHDAEWPEWYAAHMTGWLHERGYTLTSPTA